MSSPTKMRIDQTASHIYTTSARSLSSPQKNFRAWVARWWNGLTSVSSKVETKAESTRDDDSNLDNTTLSHPRSS